MKKFAVINVKGTQVIDGESDTVELTTTGKFYQKEGTYYISYLETDTETYVEHKTMVKVGSDSIVSLLKRGQRNSSLVVEQGVRHQCQYPTDYGTLLLGIIGKNVVSTLDENGGTVDFKYSIDIGASLASENEVNITVKI